MPRGGRRTGTPGNTYSNRSDLARNYTGQTYGTATQQAASQAAVPMAQPPTGAPAPAGPPMPAPGEMGAFNRGTERGMEPVTAGLPMGAGPGPEALGMDFRDPPAIAELRAIYKMFPDPDLAELLEGYDHGVTF